MILLGFFVSGKLIVVWALHSRVCKKAGSNELCWRCELCGFFSLVTFNRLSQAQGNDLIFGWPVDGLKIRLHVLYSLKSPSANRGKELS